MIRILKIFWVLLLSSGLLVLMGWSSLLPADETDVPHQTHLAAARGPEITDCGQCHTGTPVYDNVNWSICNTCHAPEGAFDRVNYPEVWAGNNWDNMNDPGDAAESLIYELDGRLKSGKSKWCATCHDQVPSQATILIDDFEGYTDNAGIRINWLRRQDAKLPFLEPQSTGATGPDGSQCMRVRIKWIRTTYTLGTVKRVYDPYIDLTGTGSVNFYVKVPNTAKIQEIKVRLQKYPEGTLCVATLHTSQLENGVWKQVSLPRTSFNDTTWGKVSQIQFRIIEYSPNNNWITNVYFDDIGFGKAGPQGGGPNVCGDNQTYGYYKTGHKMSCTQCHDSTSAHIDGQSLPVLQYIKTNPNPTNFRFYDDSTKEFVLPYNGYDDYVPGPEGSFALCYRCHDETNLIGDPWGGNTNFVDQSPSRCGLPPNLHYLHVVNFAKSPWPASCVHCHDPHGRFNPAMTRKEMGDAIVFDANGCEITDQEGRHDPAVNKGLAFQSRLGPINGECEACHASHFVTPPNTGCQGNNPYTTPGCLNDGYYLRTYQRVPHSGAGVDPSCGVQGCHDGTQGSHATHTQGTPKGPAPLACEDCHVGGTVAVDDMVAAGACDPCHSPGGVFDGMDDPAVGALSNWDGGVYESDGNTLKPGKEKWCVTCHDGGASVCDGVSAPNVDLFYGSGHGRSGAGVECLECHDATFDHIDGDPRTYAFDEADYDPDQSGVAYASGYRLRYASGGVPMMIPADYGATFNNNYQTMMGNAFRLCFECHDRSKILNHTSGDGMDTNFKAGLPNPPRDYSYSWRSGGDTNEHLMHILAFVGPYSDSDWDTSTTGGWGWDGSDSLMSCPTCHNVHGATGTDGSTNEAMIRDGSLAGRTGYGFSYVIEDVAGYPWVTSINATQSESVGAIFRNNTAKMCGGSMCHGNPSPPPGSSYDAGDSGWPTYLEYYRPWQDYSK